MSQQFPIALQASGKARIVFWTGLVSLIMFFTVIFIPVSFLLAVVSLAMTPAALNEIKRSQGILTGQTMVHVWATISGIIIGLDLLMFVALIQGLKG